ncbi:MAG: restriction endonuclease subunit S [Candidatus Methanoperedens sp.]|nr:restriction endonuclease subunit S [Candidatus Methanoperedens sp.]
MSEKGEADMSSSLKYETFGSLLINVVDNRGKTCPTADSGIPLIATNCIVNNYLYPIYEKVRYITEETYKTWFRDHPRPGDMIFVLKGTPGRVAWVPDPVDFCIAQDMVAIRADEGKIFPKYLFAVLRSDTIQQQIEGLHVGSLIPHFKKGDFDELKIPIVEPKLQEFIGNQYFDLSLKIDLLHRQNKTLEALAETLFRQWFVEEAEEGWGEGKLADVITVKGGTTPSTKEPRYWNGTIYWTSPRDLSNHAGIFLFDTNQKITEEGLAQIGSGLLPIGTVLLSSRAPIGYLAITDIPVAINQGYIGIVCDKHISNYFIYLWCKQNMETIKNAGNGSVFEEISKGVFKELDIIIPPKEQLNNFDIQVNSYFQKIRINQKQIRTLEKLRDTLLPKLMGGEVRVEYEVDE